MFGARNVKFMLQSKWAAIVIDELALTSTFSWKQLRIAC